MDRRTGGSAFPIPLPLHQMDLCKSPGMTLRDWFAGQALAGLCSIDSGTQDDAKLAYEIADKMLEARNG